jgi:tetratricopeptide (TPR) repeat protein
LALFGRKKEDATKPGTNGAGNGNGNGDGGKAGGAPEEGPSSSPDKAAVFFDRAKTVQEATNYEYAMTLWLQGLRQEPTSMRGLEGFWSSAVSFMNESGGKPPSRETLREFGGRSDVEKYLEALLQWGIKQLDALLAVRAAEAAAKLNMPEPVYWIGNRAMHVAAVEKKPRKDLFIKLMEIFGKVGAFDKAVESGGAALKLDPTDGKLSAEVRNLAAQATMNKGGYEQSGQAGGFRANIKDLERQRQLEEGERIVKTEEVVDRLLREAKADYEARPDDLAAVSKYLERLRERGRPEDEKTARELAMRTFESTKQFRFRQIYGELRLKLAARNVNDIYKAKADKNPQDPQAQAEYRQARIKFAEMEIEELKLQVEAYPTNLGLKYQLGRRDFELANYDDAIGLFQESQKDAKHRLDSLYYIGLAFQKKDWIDEAIHSFRQALELHKTHNDEMGTSLRYALMTALETKGGIDRDLALAEEADKLASSIAIQQINYRDIRARREAIKKLIAELKKAG